MLARTNGLSQPVGGRLPIYEQTAIYDLDNSQLYRCYEDLEVNRDSYHAFPLWPQPGNTDNRWGYKLYHTTHTVDGSYDELVDYGLLEVAYCHKVVVEREKRAIQQCLNELIWAHLRRRPLPGHITSMRGKLSRAFSQS